MIGSSKKDKNVPIILKKAILKFPLQFFFENFNYLTSFSVNQCRITQKFSVQVNTKPISQCEMINDKWNNYSQLKNSYVSRK